MAVGPGGSVPRREVGGVYPLAGAWLYHQEHHIPVSDYAEPAGDYGLLLNHPRFVEWIGVPQSAGLLELSGRQWVDKLSRDQAVTAAVHLQRDVGLM